MKTTHFLPCLAGGLTTLLLLGCSGKTEVAAPGPAPTSSAPASGGATAGAPVTVTTVRAQKRDLPVLLKATGAVMPLTSVDVRAQVTSVVSQVHFREGQFVKAGDLLLSAAGEAGMVNKVLDELRRDAADLGDFLRRIVGQAHP